MIKKKIGISGFSLIEALVVVSIIAVVGFIMTDVLSRTLRGGNKTQLVTIIKQNGEKALSTMDDTIRFSSSVVCAGTLTTTNDTLVVVASGNYTRFRFYVQTSTNSNGYIEKDTFTINDANQATNVLCTQEQNAAQIDTAKTYLTDRDPLTGISLKDGSFNYMHNPGFKDVVGISFSLLPGTGLGPSVENQVGGSVPFATSIELR